MPPDPSKDVALVTGGHGFAGRHLVGRLAAAGKEVIAPARSELDLLDGGAVRAAVRASRPSVVFHLAAFTSARLSWESPQEVLSTNVGMALNLLEAVRREAPAAVVALVSSGQVYGEPEALPVTEDAALEPLNPYAVSKAAADLLGGQYAWAHGTRVVRLRPFNHAGPGQSDEYVLPAMARQVAEAEQAGRDEVLLRTGDVSAGRDFTDVRDVVRAYILAAEAEPGTYNVCSGRSSTIAELIGLVRAEARLPVRQEIDPARVRSHEPREMRGSYDRLAESTGWQPEIPLAETVRATLDWWRDVAAAGRRDATLGRR